MGMLLCQFIGASAHGCEPEDHRIKTKRQTSTRPETWLKERERERRERGGKERMVTPLSLFSKHRRPCTLALKIEIPVPFSAGGLVTHDVIDLHVSTNGHGKNGRRKGISPGQMSGVLAELRYAGKRRNGAQRPRAHPFKMRNFHRVTRGVGWDSYSTTV